jgi:hypothetical protein
LVNSISTNNRPGNWSSIMPLPEFVQFPYDEELWQWRQYKRLLYLQHKRIPY